MKIEIGDKIQDLPKLSAGDGLCVMLPSDVDVSNINPRKFVVKFCPGLCDLNEESLGGHHMVTAKPENFRKYVRPLMMELKDNPEEIQKIESFENLKSERATIHAVACDLNLKISCSYAKEDSEYSVSIREFSNSKKLPSWWYSLDEDFKEIGFKGLFSNFRTKIYRLAKSKDVKLTISPKSENICLIKLIPSDKLKSNMTLVNDFLDVIPQGESLELPESLSSITDNYIRVLCSKHDHDLTFTKGKVNHHTKGPRIDSKKNFIYNGKNFGKREPAFIRLKLSNTEYDAEQFIKENTK